MHRVLQRRFIWGYFFLSLSLFFFFFFFFPRGFFSRWWGFSGLPGMEENDLFSSVARFRGKANRNLEKDSRYFEHFFFRIFEDRKVERNFWIFYKFINFFRKKKVINLVFSCLDRRRELIYSRNRCDCFVFPFEGGIARDRMFLPNLNSLFELASWKGTNIKRLDWKLLGGERVTGWNALIDRIICSNWIASS